jgi:hypothetical protein
MKAQRVQFDYEHDEQSHDKLIDIDLDNYNNAEPSKSRSATFSRYLSISQSMSSKDLRNGFANEHFDDPQN